MYIMMSPSLALIKKKSKKTISFFQLHPYTSFHLRRIFFIFRIQDIYHKT